MTERTLGRYRLLDPLGAGGMGEVWLASDPELGREVALKILPSAAADDPRRLAMFRREARAVAALNHPNIVTLYTVEETEGTHFLTMERVEGRTLEACIPSSGLELDAFFPLARQLVDAVAAAHARGVTHRDLKPTNVMVDETGRVKVLDFGLARMHATSDEGERGETLTADAVIVGTVPYMAPEQLQGRPVDQRSDVFALGVILYEMLSGRRPFAGGSMAELTSAILRDEPVCLGSLRAVPHALEALVRRCLRKGPADRFQTAEDLHHALQDAEQAPTLALDEGVPAPPSRRSLSVAVADFQNIAGAAEVDWLSTGIAETVTVDLKKISALTVLGRERIAREAGTAAGAQVARQELAAVGQRLDIDWMVGGGFQVAGSRIRITAWFVDVARGEVAGSVKVDGTLDEIFELQDRIVAGLTESLDLEVSDTDQVKLERAETPQLEAFECFARGRSLVHAMRPESFDEARTLFEQAVEIDPRYALAYSGLGSLHMMRYIGTTDPTDLAVGVSYLERAVELDPALADPLCWLSYGRMRQHRFEDAVDAAERAIALEAENPLAHYFLGTAWWTRGVLCFQPGSWTAAARALRRVTELAPRYHAGFMVLGDCYMRMGRYEEAGRVLEHAAEIERSGDYQFTRFVGAFGLLGRLRLREGNVPAAHRAFATSLEVLDGVEHVYAAACRAMAHLGLGDVASREGRPDVALNGYRGALEEARRHRRALGIGWIVIRAHIGESRAFGVLGMERERQAALVCARDLYDRRGEYDFSGIWEGGPLQIEYDLARYDAGTGRREQALAHVERAIQAGWHDVHALENDPELRSLRGVELERICRRCSTKRISSAAGRSRRG